MTKLNPSRSSDVKVVCTKNPVTVIAMGKCLILPNRNLKISKTFDLAAKADLIRRVTLKKNL